MELEKFLTPQDFSYLKKITNEPPENWFKNIYIYITEKCQLHCKHCYLGERLKKETMMPKKEVFDNLVFWKRIGGRKLCFLGGEPTLHPHFEEIVKYANKLGYEKVTMDTNGLQIALNKLSNLDYTDFSYIQISLDGGSSLTHDSIRGDNTFNTVLNTIKELRKRKFDIRIICTVNRHNIKDCLNILSIADNLGVSLVKYHIFSGIGRGRGNDHLLINPNEWIKFINLLLEQKNKYKTKIQYQVAYGDESLKDLLLDQKYTGCLGRKLDRMSIFSDKKVYICSYLFDKDLNFAEVDLKNHKLLIKRERQSEIDLFFSKLKKCDECNFNDICFDGCQAEKIVNNYYPCSKYHKIYPVCRLWKASV